MRMLAAALLLALSGVEGLTAAGISDEEYRKLRADLRLKSRGWASLPWRATLTEAREAALRERKPIFMMVDTGNPIGFA